MPKTSARKFNRSMDPEKAAGENMARIFLEQIPNTRWIQDQYRVPHTRVRVDALWRYIEAPFLVEAKYDFSGRRLGDVALAAIRVKRTTYPLPYIVIGNKVTLNPGSTEDLEYLMKDGIIWGYYDAENSEDVDRCHGDLKKLLATDPEARLF